MFEGCYELKQAFELLFRRTDRLMLVTNGEVYGSCQRVVKPGDEDEGQGKEEEEEQEATTEMDGVEHLGKYVYEITKARVESLKDTGGVDAATGAVLREEDMVDVSKGEDDEMVKREDEEGTSEEE